eukprot:Pgem_evm1s1193
MHRQIIIDFDNDNKFLRTEGLEPTIYSKGDKVHVRIYTFVRGQDLVGKWQPNWSNAQFTVIAQVGPNTYQVQHKRDFRIIDVVDLKHLHERDPKLNQVHEFDESLFEGQNHGWNDLDDDELSVNRLIGKWLCKRKGQQTIIYYNIEFSDKTTEWCPTTNLRCEHLINNYEKSLTER